MIDPVVITHASIAVVAIVLVAAVPLAIVIARAAQRILEGMAS